MEAETLITFDTSTPDCGGYRFCHSFRYTVSINHLPPRRFRHSVQQIPSNVNNIDEEVHSQKEGAEGSLS